MTGELRGSGRMARLDTVSEPLYGFRSAADSAAHRAALLDIIKARQLPKVASDSGLRESLELLARSIRDETDELDRLHTVAALERAANTARSLRKPVTALLEEAVTKPLSGLHELPDPDDRRYAARVWRVVRRAWSVNDLATAAVREESGEKARTECMEAIVALSDNLEQGLTALRTPLLALSFETKQPRDSLGKRVIRVLRALNAAVSRSDRPVGSDAGRALSELVRHGFRKTGRPETRKVREELVKQVAVVTHTIVRADYTHGAKVETYAALRRLSDWFPAHGWEKLCGSSVAISRVQGDVEKGLTLLVELGKPDDGLRGALITVAGSRKKAEAICRRIAREHPGIPEELRHWLAGISKRITSASVAESQERSVDQVLAELLLAMRGLSRASDVVASEVVPEASIVLPQAEPALLRLTRLVDALESTLGLAATRRSLRLRGAVGQEVDFTPVDHEFLTMGVRSRRVRLVSPGVERIGEDGVPRTVLKATVEPIADERPSEVGDLP